MAAMHARATYFDSPIKQVMVRAAVAYISEAIAC